MWAKSMGAPAAWATVASPAAAEAAVAAEAVAVAVARTRPPRLCPQLGGFLLLARLHDDGGPT